MEPKFLAGEPALVSGRILIISDLHVGIEREYRIRGIKMPSQTDEMKKRLHDIIRKNKIERLVICGDLKHKVPGSTYQEEKEIPELMSGLSKIKVDIVQGNHDADLRELLPDKVELHSTRGFLSDGIYFSHGHTWPDSSFLEADYFVTGHVQPQIEIKDKLGYVWREPVWLKGFFDKKKINDNLSHISKKTLEVKKVLEFIVLPSFNKMAGGLAVNKKEFKESPILKLVNIDKSDVFLLDGTFLGKLNKI